jgi:hypothetical protein
MNKSKLLVIPILALLLSISACASMDQTMKIAPLGMNYPVSASSSLYVGEQTLSEDQLHQAKHFEFMKYFSPKMAEREVQLDLAADLTKVIDENGANAITKLEISVEDIHADALTWIEFERATGVTIAITGAAVFAGVASNATNTSGAQSVEEVAAIMTAAGAAIFAGSWLHRAFATVDYTIKISGTTVRY